MDSFKSSMNKFVHSKYLAVFALAMAILMAYPFHAVAISPQDASSQIESGSAILVDVREQDEVASGMAKPAMWLPTSKIDADSQEWKDFLAEQKKDRNIIVYCRSGKRAGRVVERLTKLGFKAENMGGFSDWEKAGLPTKNPNLR